MTGMAWAESVLPQPPDADSAVGMQPQRKTLLLVDDVDKMFDVSARLNSRNFWVGICFQSFPILNCEWLDVLGSRSS